MARKPCRYCVPFEQRRLAFRTPDPGKMTLGDVVDLQALLVVEQARRRGEWEVLAWLRGEGHIEAKRSGVVFVYHRPPSVKRNAEGAASWRKAVFQRDNWACRQCGADGHVQAHHVLPWATHAATRFDVDNGLTLCLPCHAAEHPKHARLILSTPPRHRMVRAG